MGVKGSNVQTKGLFDKCFDFTRADDIKKNGVYPYFRPIQDSEGPIVSMEGRKVIMAGSNNYLGLTTHPKVIAAAKAAIDQYGTSCSGSRYLTGTVDLHVILEEKLAKFVGKESALLFSTGYQTGQGVIQPLLGRNDYILSDKDNHASIVTGNLLCKASGTEIIRFKHKDVEDLERCISKLPEEAGKLIVTDGVFSTFGEICPLDEIVKVAKKYNAQILVDDAHAIGVIGEGGKGTASHFGLTDEVDLVMCTFSKTFASLGGFVAGPERVINYLKHQSPALIFSASPTPPSVAAAIAALEILESEPEYCSKLRSVAQRFREGVKEMGFNVIDGQSAIVPVIIGDDEKAFKIWKTLYDAGVFVNVFISPATPPGMAMLRNSFMATHTFEHIDTILDVYQKAGKELGLI